MKNLKVKQFNVKMVNIIAEKKELILEEVSKHLEIFNTIDLIVFTNEAPYTGEIKNKIFFTYCNHYRHNSGIWMSVNELTHPHRNYEDRGYLKGVATDLNGYIELRDANRLNHNMAVSASVWFPRFTHSKNHDEYVKICNNIVTSGIEDLNLFVEQQKAIMNEKLKEITGCSLLYYIQSI